MLSPTAPVYGNIASATSRALAGLQRSVSRVLESDAAEKILDSGDGGQHVYASRLGSEVKSKQVQITSLQNAISFTHSQRAVLSVAMDVFSRMGELAVKATDPILTSSDRKNLDLEFNELRNLANEMGKKQFNDQDLFRSNGSSFFSENFDTLALNPFVSSTEEIVMSGDSTDWTATPPSQWSMNKAAGHGSGGGTPIPEFDGWTFMDPQSWQNTAAEVVGDGGQSRNLFTKGAGVIAVADSDEFDDDGYAGIQFDAALRTPSIDISGAEAGQVKLNYDSSWRNEPQVGKVVVSFDGGSQSTILQMDGSSPDAFDESVELSVNNPEGAKSMQVAWDYRGTNNWWWAIDNIEVSEEEDPKLEVFTGDQFMDLENIEVPRFLGSSNLNLLTGTNASSAVTTLNSYVEQLGAQKALLGSNLSELELSIDRLNRQVVAGKVSLDRMTDEEMAEDLIRLSRDKIVSEGNLALMTQARGINQNLVNTLL